MFVLVHLDANEADAAAVASAIESMLGLTTIQHAVTIQGE